MEEKQIRKWLRRQFRTVGWALVVYYAIMNILVVISVISDMISQALQKFASGAYPFLPDMDAIANNAWGYLVSIAVGLVILYAWKGSDFFRWEIFAKGRPMEVGVFFGTLCLCSGAQLVNSLWITLLEAFLNLFGLSALGILESVSGQSDSFSMFLYSALAAPIAEEILFRGFVLRSLRPFGKRFAIFGSALLFGLFHGNLLQTPYAFLVGLVLGYVAVEYSVFWAIGLHMFNNLVLADMLSRLTAFLPEHIASMIQLLILGCFTLAGAVILLVKRREIGAYNRSEWMDRRCLKCFFLNSGVLVMILIALVNMAAMVFV